MSDTKFQVPAQEGVQPTPLSALFGAGMQRHLNSGRHVVVIHGDGCIVGFASYSDHRAQRFDEQEPGDTTEHTNTVNVAP